MNAVTAPESPGKKTVLTENVLSAAWCPEGSNAPGDHRMCPFRSMHGAAQDDHFASGFGRETVLS